MKNLIILFIFLGTGIILVKAQQIPQFSQRQLDVVEFNPSIAGSQLNHEIRLHYRTQWVGFEGSPVTQLISYSGAVGKSSGLGAYIINDKEGACRKKGINLGYAYHIPFEKFNLSLGLSGTMLQYSINGNVLEVPNPADNAMITSKMKSNVIPAFSFGTFIYNSRGYIGLSALQMTKGTMKEETNAYIPANLAYFIIGGYDVSPNEKFNIVPSMLIAGSKMEQAKIEVGIKAEYLKKIMLGLSYRHKDAVSFLCGFSLGKQFFMTYSYDYTLSALNKYNSGSHEVVIYIQLPYGRNNAARLFDYEKRNRLELKQAIR